MKKLITAAVLLYFVNIAAQQGKVGINTNSPASTLDIVAKTTDGSQAEGVKAPLLTGNALYTAGINAKYTILQDGTIVYVTVPANPSNRTGQTEYVDAKGPYYFDASMGTTGKWVRIGAETTISPSISSLDCSAALNAGSLNAGMAASGASTSVPYTGANGAAFNAQDVISTGVTGLIAHLQAGVLSNGNGSFTYTLSGTPTSAGTASFPITIAGQSCTFTRNVGLPVAVLSTINCQGVVNNGTLTEGVASSGTTSQIPYTGGNGGTYSGQSVNSTGVAGLTATLPAGTLATGSGQLSFTITGTPSSSGTASFAINMGGQSCTFSRSINAPAGTISSFDCSGAYHNGYLKSGESANGVNSIISYSGGNGGTYNGQSVSSTGVSGLTATLSAGTLTNGSGSLTFTITGTPSGNGLAMFAVSIGGQNCTFTRTVGCGAYVSPGQWKEFLCHNLGADTSLDPHNMSQLNAWGLNGAYITWGKRGPVISGYSPVDWKISGNDAVKGFIAAPTGSNYSQANADPPNPWSGAPASLNYSWRTLAGAKTINDPCPGGYRVPTQAEWNGIISNNTITRSGVWSTTVTVANYWLSYTSGMHFGSGSTVTLTLPATGYRDGAGGYLSQRGIWGNYWSSTENPGNLGLAVYLTFNGGGAGTQQYPRDVALTIRCIAE